MNSLLDQNIDEKKNRLKFIIELYSFYNKWVNQKLNICRDSSSKQLNFEFNRNIDKTRNLDQKC